MECFSGSTEGLPSNTPHKAFIRAGWTDTASSATKTDFLYPTTNGYGNQNSTFGRIDYAFTKNHRSGDRTDAVSKEDLLQLVGYVLFDTRNIYGITGFGIYSARYGNLIVWPVQEGLEKLADGPVDLSEERTKVVATTRGN